jgi:flagellar biosynthesis protein FliQ
MTPDLAVELLRRAVTTALMVTAPLLLTALLVGVVISLVQAVTQIQEQTLTFVPKLLAMAVIFIISLPWILTRLVDYLVGMLQTFGTLVG